jgi:hypothetical protein
MADDVAQFPTRQGRIAVGQEHSKDRVNQRKVLIDIAGLLAAMDLQDVLEPVYLRHLAGLLVNPVYLLCIKVFAEDLAVFFT